MSIREARLLARELVTVLRREPEFVRAVAEEVERIRQASEGEEWLSSDEACAYLKRSRSWLKQHPEIGRVRQGRKLLFAKRELQAWREQNICPVGLPRV